MTSTDQRNPVRRRTARRAPRWAAAALPALLALVAACGQSGSPATPTNDVRPPPSDPGRKVMIIAEENEGYQEIIGNPEAPYLNQLAADHGTATRFDAGYPAECPSLAAYILMTSGSTDNICDDDDPAAHPLHGDNVFHQVAASGKQWRNYAQAAPGNCVLTDHDHYFVRHVPATYFTNERGNCRRWAVPLGDTNAGALHDDVASGLPAYAYVTPDACHDMHGDSGCDNDLIATGDQWLRSWLPQIMAGPDYRAGRLTIIVTWDEGTETSNHIATLVVAPAVQHISTVVPLNQCSTLRFTEEQLGLPLLGCATRATSLGTPFGL